MLTKNQHIGQRLSRDDMKNVLGGIREGGPGCAGLNGICTTSANCCNSGCPLPSQEMGIYCVRGRCSNVYCP